MNVKFTDMCIEYSVHACYAGLKFLLCLLLTVCMKFVN